MMLAHDNLRVSHVTTHCAIADVPQRITPVRLRRVFDVTIDALHRLGLKQPRIAVAGLNPHAGEGGILGKEDDAIVAPVIREYQAKGIDMHGPIPGDTVFIKLRAGQYDAVVAMFHDQGHIPVKLLGFNVDPATGKWQAISGVNITLGLPILRTSVDHGTADALVGSAADCSAACEHVPVVDCAAAEFAGDLQRLLRREPVLARRGSRRYRWSRFAARHGRAQQLGGGQHFIAGKGSGLRRFLADCLDGAINTVTRGVLHDAVGRFFRCQWNRAQQRRLFTPEC